MGGWKNSNYPSLGIKQCNFMVILMGSRIIVHEVRVGNIVTPVLVVNKNPPRWNLKTGQKKVQTLLYRFFELVISWVISYNYNYITPVSWLTWVPKWVTSPNKPNHRYHHESPMFAQKRRDFFSGGPGCFFLSWSKVTSIYIIKFTHFRVDQTWCKCMAILRDCHIIGALLGLEI